LEAFLARNFYPDRDLQVDSVIWGHWSNMKYRRHGNPYGRLYGGHRFATRKHRNSRRPMIYIYRDGRAVAYSVWKSDNFLHKDLAGISFSDFLRVQLDWRGSPRFKPEAKHPAYTIAEHWYHHVHSWVTWRRRHYLVVRYEDLKRTPEAVYREIRKTFFPIRHLWEGLFPHRRRDVDPVADRVGISPNRATIDAWKEAFTEADERFFGSQLPDARYLDSGHPSEVR
jgi:hypothetical protein